MDAVKQIIVAGMLIEAVVQIAKDIVSNGKVDGWKIASILIGVLVAFLCNLQLLSIAGFAVAFVPADYILTGIIISRGANFISDLFDKLKGVTNG